MSAVTFTAFLATVLLATLAHSGYAAYIPNLPQSSCSKLNTITVTKTGRHPIKHAIAVISVGMQVKGSTRALAEKNLLDEYRKLSAYLRSQKAKKIQAKYFTVYQDISNSSSNYSHSGYATPEPVPYNSKGSGYSASQTVTFEVPLAARVAVSDGAVRNGATRVDGTSYKGDPLEYEAGRKIAIGNAIAKAKKEASSSAKILRKAIGKIVSINIAADGGQNNYIGNYGSAAGEEIVTAFVTVSFYMA